MSTLAKIFIVLNLLFAMAFTVATLTLYAKRLHWVDYVKKSIDENNSTYRLLVERQEQLNKKTKEFDELTLEFGGYKSRSEAVINEKSQANLTLKNHIAEQEGRLGDIRLKIEDLQSEVRRKEERNTKLQDMVDKLIAERNDYRTRMEFAEQRVIEALADLKQSETELMNVAKQNAELVRRIALVSTRLDQYVVTYGPMDRDQVTPTVPIRGRVLRKEDEALLVILDVGEKDNVKKGMEFLISRGDTLTGKVRILNVLEDMSSARIIPGYGRGIEVADLAATIK